MRFGVNDTTSGVDYYDEGGTLDEDGIIFQFSAVNGPNAPLSPITDEAEGPFFPVWQYSPQIPVPVVNSDFRTLPMATAELNAYLADGSKRNVVGPAFTFEEGEGGAVFVDLLVQRWQGGVEAPKRSSGWGCRARTAWPRSLRPHRH